MTAPRTCWPDNVTTGELIGLFVLTWLIMLVGYWTTAAQIERIDKAATAYCSRSVAVMTPDGSATSVCAP